MARRSNELTSVIGSIDKRLKIIETSNVTSVPAGTYLPSPADDEGTTSAPGSSTPSAPWTYRKIDSAYIYGNKATRGFGTRVELFLDLDDNNDNTLDFDLQLGTSPINSAFIQISGLNGNSSVQYDLSGTFKLLDYDVLASSPTRQTWRVTPPAGATHSLFYSPVIQGNESEALELISKRAIDSASATGSVITIVFNSAHIFKVDDVIYTDLPAPFFGIDGLFRITEVVDSNTIRVELNSPLASPETYTWTNPNPRRYVYSVVHRYVEEGTVWIDESVVPNKVYVWRGIRWYDTADPIGDVSVTKDGIAPSPVTNFTAVTSIPSGLAYPVIDLSWTPPTTRSNGDPIAEYLDGYEIWYKKSTDTDSQWKKQQVKDGGQGISVFRISDPAVEKDITYNIRIYVVDIMAQFSTAVTANVATPSAARPSPVTNLAGTSEIPTGSSTPIINLTWTPTTTRVDGGSLAGALSGYDVWFKRSTELTWKTQFVASGGQTVSSHTIKDEALLQNVTYNIRVYSVDSQNLRSDAAEINVVTSKYSDVLNAPSKPIVSSRLRTITVAWDGKDSAGNLPVPGVVYIEFHESTTSGFTPSASTLVESTAITNSGNSIVLTGRQFDPANPASNPTYYYKTRFVRQVSPLELETSAASIQSDGQKVVGVVGPDLVANTLTVNEIDTGLLTAALVRGDIIRAGASATSARVELKKEGIFAYNGIGTDPATFEMQSSNGSVLIRGGSLTSPIITGGTIQTTDLASRGVKITNSGLTAFSNSGVPTFTVAADSGNVAIVGGSLTSPTVTGGILQTNTEATKGVRINTSGLIAYNNTTNQPMFTVDTVNGSVVINGGTLTITSGLSGYIPTGGAAADVNSGTVTISGGKITANTIEADQISANAISAYIFQGREIRLSAFSDNSNPKISLNKDRIAAFRANGTTTFRLTKDGDFYADDVFIDNATVTGTITGGTLVGGTIRTVAAGNTSKRLIINTSGQIVFFDQNSTTVAGTIEAENNYLSFKTSSGPTLNVTPTTVSVTGTNGNLSTSGNVFAGERVGAFNLRTTSVRYVTTLSDQSGYTQLGAIVPSDERIKQNIQTTDLGLTFINDIDPVQFDYINKEIDIDNGPQFGVIAQQLKSALAAHGVPEENGMVYKSFNSDNEDDYLYLVNRDQLIAPLIKAIQELSEKVSKLEASSQ